MSWKQSEALLETIKHYSNFPATGVSLRQMVQFGERPSTGMSSGCALWVVPHTDDSSAQAQCSRPRRSLLKNFPYGSRIACRSLAICPTVSTRCPRFRKCGIGTLNRSKYVSEVGPDWFSLLIRRPGNHDTTTTDAVHRAARSIAETCQAE